MTSHFSIKFEFEYRWYEANVSVVYHDDNKYGADADGGRGEFRRFVDDVIVRGVIDDQGTLVAPTEAMIECINEVAEEKME